MCHIKINNAVWKIKPWNNLFSKWHGIPIFSFTITTDIWISLFPSVVGLNWFARIMKCTEHIPLTEYKYLLLRHLVFIFTLIWKNQVTPAFIFFYQAHEVLCITNFFRYTKLYTLDTSMFNNHQFVTYYKNIFTTATFQNDKKITTSTTPSCSGNRCLQTNQTFSKHSIHSIRIVKFNITLNWSVFPSRNCLI